jgi:hypothetical protein
MTKLHVVKKKLIEIFRFFQKQIDIINHDVHVCILHLYDTLTHSSRFEPKILWKHTMILMTKPLQNHINKK